MDTLLSDSEIPWLNCVGVLVDNTSVNMGKNNSIKTRMKTKISATYFMACPCHILHKTCMKAADVFSKVRLYHDKHI